MFSFVPVNFALDFFNLLLVKYLVLFLSMSIFLTDPVHDSEKHDSEWTPSRMDTIPNGHNPEWTPSRKTQSRMDTIPNGHNPEWTQSRMDTIPNGHNPEWTPIPNGYNPEWTQSRMGMIPNEHLQLYSYFGVL